MFSKNWMWLLVSCYWLLGQEHPSIHQLQLEYYNQHYVEPQIKHAAESIIPKQYTERTPSREVFGYHPYWMGTNWQNYNFDLLTTVAYFSAEATATGQLSNLHGWPVTGLINLAHNNGVDVVLCVTLFNNSELTTLLSDSTYRQNLIDNLLNQVQQGNADGVNVDFEQFPTSQKQNMVQFITDLTNAFHTNIPGSQVTLATPAVDWSNGWDYDALAAISDGLFIMGYGYHWGGSSTTGAVAPLTGGTYNITWTVNDYLTNTNNQADKIILGCPYYGYEWPATSGQAGASTTGSGLAKFYSAAEPLAQAYGKLWDTNSQTPWYRYENPGWYQGWYDDSLSLSLKYDLALQNDLKGVGMWALGYDGTNSELWDALANKFSTATAPTIPSDLALRNTGGGSIMITFSGSQTADQFVVLRGYSDNASLDTLDIFSSRPIIIDGLNLNEAYFLRIVATNNYGESQVTEMLGIVPSVDPSDILIVNGFDRISGTTNTFDYIRQHGTAIHNNSYIFDSASNEAVVNGTVVLNNYKAVDWILGEEGSATSSFTETEQNLVKTYLENGGHLFVSGSEIGYDLSSQGSNSDQQFYLDYLKAEYISDAAGGQQGVYSAYGNNESIFEGVSNITFDDGTHGTYDVDWPDGIKPAGDAQVCAQYTGIDYNTQGGAGISYTGLFGSSILTGAVVYLAFGFEAIYPESKREEVMDRILTFFEEASGNTNGHTPLPQKFEITKIYPNPFNSMVTIVLELPDQISNGMTFSITDLLGRTVVTYQIPTTASNPFHLKWNGRWENGRLAPSGVYLAVLEINQQSNVKKFSLLK